MKIKLFGSILFLASLIGCVKAPTQEMNDADYALNRAIKAGASEYASAELTLAQERWLDAKALLESRDFSRAKTAALDAKTKSETAKSVAENNRLMAKNRAEALVAQIKPEIEATMEKAADVRGRSADKIHQDALELGQMLKQVEADLAAGRYNASIERANEGMTKVGLLNTAIQAATPPPARRKRR